MTITEQRKAIKGEAFNKITRIYNPKAKVNYSRYTEDDGNYAEQRDAMVRRIMEEMYEKLKNLRIKAREEKERREIVIKNLNQKL
ncbi:MAG TPA: hypothetical protein VK172_10240 [Lentimicrobium sp.]|nr:hypothetical protein [Lentimicrobium sp.]